MTVPRKWRKSSFSGQEVDCVAVANTLGAVRDTKNPGVVLTVDMSSFVAMLARGELD